MLNGGDMFSLRRIMDYNSIQTMMRCVEMSDQLVAQQHRKVSPMARVMEQSHQPVLGAADESVRT